LSIGFQIWRLCRIYHTKCSEIVHKPALLSHEETAACLASGLKAYTALYYQMKMVAGESILIHNAAEPEGQAAIQLATIWGAKILTTCTSVEQAGFLQRMNAPIHRIINLNTEKLLEIVVQETSNLGVDCIFDNHKQKHQHPKKEFIQCLGILGRWVTTVSDLQLDPPECQILSLKGASISFLFEQTWLLSNNQQGRFLHIMNDLMDKFSKGQILPKIAATFSLDEIQQAHQKLETYPTGKIVVKLY